MSAVPPLLERRALLQLVVECLICLAQKIAQVGHADIQRGVRGNPVQQIAAIARLRKRNLFDLLLQCRELGEEHEVFIAIVAPCNLLLHWLGAQLVIGGELVSRRCQRVQPCVQHVHRALKHCHTRALQAGVH